MENIPQIEPSSYGIQFKESIESIANFFHEKYRFEPYGDSISIGRSSLSYQLANPNDFKNRDCKLPTFELAKYIAEALSIPAIIATCNGGSHPYLFVPKRSLMTLDGKRDIVDDIALKISYHPYEVGVSDFEFFRQKRSIGWLFGPEAKKMAKVSIHNFDENGSESLDLTFSLKCLES